jgi:nanoRNase/pAp phosphatase (c-di-AMP/oligoRNAs hydrolase)
LVFAEQNISELGNELCKMNPDIDFVIMVEMGTKKISLRTVRDDIHLGELAKEIGGGGHPKAAGAQFDEQKIIDFLGDLF